MPKYRVTIKEIISLTLDVEALSHGNAIAIAIATGKIKIEQEPGHIIRVERPHSAVAEGPRLMERDSAGMSTYGENSVSVFEPTPEGGFKQTIIR